MTKNMVFDWANVPLPDYCEDYNSHRLSGCEGCSLSICGRDCRNNRMGGEHVHIYDVDGKEILLKHLVQHISTGRVVEYAGGDEVYLHASEWRVVGTREN